jgi:hypothetical protein
MPIIQHQFLNQDWFIPNWESQTLIIGSFNPECGEQVDFFYGREKNNKFWRSVAMLLNFQPNHFFQGNAEERLAIKIKYLQSLGWGCVDFIREIDVREHFKPRICGEGYMDSNLFNVGNVNRTYNTGQILMRLNEGDVKHVIIALGDRNAPAEYNNQKQNFIHACQNIGVTVHDDSVSFSGRSHVRNVEQLADYLRPFMPA